MESTTSKGKGKSILDKKPLGERFGNKDVIISFLISINS